MSPTIPGHCGSERWRGPDDRGPLGREIMARVILPRLAALAVILLALSAIVFVLEAMIPADPVRAMVGASASKEAVAAKRHELGFDKPLPVQYLRFLGRAATGNLSESLHTRPPVMTDLRAFLPATLELAGAAGGGAGRPRPGAGGGRRPGGGGGA